MTRAAATPLHALRWLLADSGPDRRRRLATTLRDEACAIDPGEFAGHDLPTALGDLQRIAEAIDPAIERTPGWHTDWREASLAFQHRTRPGAAAREAPVHPIRHACPAVDQAVACALLPHLEKPDDAGRLAIAIPAWIFLPGNLVRNDTPTRTHRLVLHPQGEHAVLAADDAAGYGTWAPDLRAAVRIPEGSLANRLHEALTADANRHPGRLSSNLLHWNTPEGLHRTAERAERTWNALIAALEPGMLRAARQLRRNRFTDLAQLSPPNPDVAKRRLQFAGAHPAHAALILRTAAGPDRHLHRDAVADAWDLVQANAAPADAVAGLPAGDCLPATSRHLRRRGSRRSPALGAELSIQKLVDGDDRADDAANRAAAARAILRAWATSEHMRDERRQRPGDHLERLRRATGLAVRFPLTAELAAFPYTRWLADAPGTLELDVADVAASAADGAPDALPLVPAHLADAVRAWLDETLVPQLDDDMLQAALTAATLGDPGYRLVDHLRRRLAARLASLWWNRPEPVPRRRPEPDRVSRRLLRPKRAPRLTAAEWNHWDRGWHRAVARPSAAALTAAHPGFPAFPAAIDLPPGVVAVDTAVGLAALGVRQDHCIADHAGSVAAARIFCFSITADGVETTLTLRHPEFGRNLAHGHAGRRNAAAPDPNRKIARAVTRAVRAAWGRDPGAFPAIARSRARRLRPDPAAAWEGIHRGAVPATFHPLAPDRPVFATLATALTPRWQEALRLVRDAAGHGIRFYDIAGR